MPKVGTSFRLTEKALEILDELAAAKGISRTAMLEILIREAAEKKDK